MSLSSTNFNSKKLSIPLMFTLPVMLGISPGVQASCTSQERVEMVRAGLTGAEVTDACDQAVQKDDEVAGESSIAKEGISSPNENILQPNERPQNKTEKEGGFGDVVNQAGFGIIRKNIEEGDFSFTGLSVRGLTMPSFATGENKKLSAYGDILIEGQNESELDNELFDFSLGGGLAYKLQPSFIGYAGISLNARSIDRPALSEPLEGSGIGYKAGFLRKLSDQFILFGEYHVVNLDDEVGGGFDRYGGGLSWIPGNFGTENSGVGIDLSIRYDIESYEIGGKANNLIFSIGSRF